MGARYPHYFREGRTRAHPPRPGSGCPAPPRAAGTRRDAARARAGAGSAPHTGAAILPLPPCAAAPRGGRREGRWRRGAGREARPCPGPGALCRLCGGECGSERPSGLARSLKLSLVFGSGCRQASAPSAPCPPGPVSWSGRRTVRAGKDRKDQGVRPVPACSRSPGGSPQAAEGPWRDLGAGSSAASCQPGPPFGRSVSSLRDSPRGADVCAVWAHLPGRCEGLLRQRLGKRHTRRVTALRGAGRGWRPPSPSRRRQARCTAPSTRRGAAEGQDPSTD